MVFIPGKKLRKGEKIITQSKNVTCFLVTDLDNLPTVSGLWGFNSSLQLSPPHVTPKTTQHQHHHHHHPLVNPEHHYYHPQATLYHRHYLHLNACVIPS